MQRTRGESVPQSAAGACGPRRGLRIPAISSVGRGQTLLSAFDAALYRCGVQNYNLLTLSSVIPAASEVVVCDRYEAPAAEYGHKLYVVKADVRSAEEGEVIGAGLGWLQHDDGRGIFVEHVARELGKTCGDIESALNEQVVASLRDLALRRDIDFDEGNVGRLIAVTRVERQPACSIAVAVYQSEGWQ
jgi:arginine decarboxylase